MIKFFRKIRQNLLSEGKTGKYLKYAIGEIVLVVIGILIALQVNNWNENKTNKIQLQSIFSAIKDDLKMDIKDIDSLILQMQVLEPHFLNVISNEMTLETYTSCLKCQYILSGFPDISLRENAFNLLSDFNVHKKNKQKEVIKAINVFYTFYKTEIEVDTYSFSKIFNERDNFWTKKYSWYSDYLLKKPNPDFIDYALNSYEYKNQVSSFYLVFYKLYIPHLLAYKQDALMLIEKFQ